MKPKNQAFTLVEVVIVLAIIGVLLPIVFSILLTVTRQQTKIFRLTEAKQQGDFVLAYMKSQIRRSGSKIYRDYQDGTLVFEACNDSISPDNIYASQIGTDFYIKKRDTANNYLQFYTENYPIGADTTPQRLWVSDTGVKSALTTDNVRISNFEISCYRRTTTALPFVIISFSMYYKTSLATARPEDVAVLNYKGIIKLQ